LRKALRYIVILPLIALIACTGSREDAELDKIPIKEIKQKVNEQFNKIESLEAYGTIAFDSPEMSNTGYMEIRLKKPDSVLVKIEGPFGIDIANALITRTDFIYYNVQDNKVILGPTSDINIGAILKIKVSFDELINSFSGAFYFENEEQDSIDAASENNSYVLQVNKEYGKKKYFIEPYSYVVNTYSVYDNKNRQLLEVNYSKFESESILSGTVNFPSQITINKPDTKQTVWLVYEGKELNKKNLSFKIKYPRSAKIIRWD
jgi:outer membrane lipoprotein-sorting protein